MTQTLYDYDGYLIIPSPITPALSIIHVWNRLDTWWKLDRASWIDAFRVVDARPGGMRWPIRGPKGKTK